MKYVGFAILGLIALVSALCLWLEYDSRKTLNAAKQVLIDANAPMSLEAVIPPPIADDINAAVHYDNLRAFSKAHPEIQSAMDDLLAMTDEDAPCGGIHQIYTFQIDDNQWQDIEAVLARPILDEYFAIIDQMTEQELFQPNWDYYSGPYVFIHEIGTARNASRKLLIKGAVAFRQGHIEAATKALNQVLLISRQQIQGQTLLALLTASSIQAMAFDFLEAVDRQAPDLQDFTFQPHSFALMDYWQAAFDLERLGFGEYIFNAIERGDPDYLFSIYAIWGFRRVNIPPGSWVFRYDRAAYNLFMARARILNTLSIKDVKETYASAETKAMEQAELRPWPVTTALALPTIGLYRNIVRSDTQSELARTGRALSAYRVAHGVYPPTLESLIPDFLPRLPIDHFADAPLIYRLESEGYALYSIGQNRTDNGGIAEDQQMDAEDNFDLIWAGHGSVLKRPIAKDN
jgi:hypothetical protein